MTSPFRISLALSLGCCALGSGAASAQPLAVGQTATPGAAGDSVAVVDGTPITRAQLDRTLEELFSAQVLPQLIQLQVLFNAARARGQSVSEADVENELARLQNRPALQAALQGARRNALATQVRARLTLQKLLTAGIAEPTDAQLQAFFARYRAYYGAPRQVRLGFLVTSKRASALFLEQQLKNKRQTFEQLVAQQKRGADALGARSTLDTGQFSSVDSLPFPPTMELLSGGNWKPLIEGAAQGQVLPPAALSPSGPYLLVRVVAVRPAVQGDFQTLRPQLLLDYKLAQVAQEEIKKNPTSPASLDDTLKQARSYLAQSNGSTSDTQPPLRDTLTLILQPATQNLLNTLRASAQITITDPALEQSLASSPPNTTASPRP